MILLFVIYLGLVSCINVEGIYEGLSLGTAKEGKSRHLSYSGIWLYSSYIVAVMPDLEERPYLITLHGTLHPKAQNILP